MPCRQRPFWLRLCNALGIASPAFRPLAHPDLRRRAAALSSIRRIDCRATHDRMDAPWVIDGAMNAEMFDRYITTQLEATRKGDLVILDNLSSHKSPGAARALHAVGAWFLFLPPYNPDLNPRRMYATIRRPPFIE